MTNTAALRLLTYDRAHRAPQHPMSGAHGVSRGRVESHRAPKGPVLLFMPLLRGSYLLKKNKNNKNISYVGLGDTGPGDVVLSPEVISWRLAFGDTVT